MNTTKFRIIYVYDALCGWCYGFSPVMRRLHDTYADAFDFEVLSGGMMTGTRVRPVAESMSYIQQAYKVVEEHTGVRFGRVAEFGINGFPAVLVQTGPRLHQIARGYLPYEPLVENLMRVKQGG